MGVDLIPPFSQGEFTVALELPAGTPLASTERTVRAIERDLLADPRIARVFSRVGEDPELGRAAAERRENLAQINLAIADRDDREQERRVVAAVRERVARESGIRAEIRRPSYFSFRTPIEVHVFGRDLDAIRRTADRLVVDLREMPGFADVRSSLEEGSPEVQVSFRRERLAALDLDLDTISRTLRNKIHGEVATRLKESDRQLDVIVRTAGATELDVDHVPRLVVDQVDGIPVNLSSVADVEIGVGPSRITHIGQQRAAVIRADLSGLDLAGAAERIETLLRRSPPPADVAARLGGQHEEVATAFRGFALAVFLAVFMVYLVMASQFESFLHPLVILFSVPLGLIGVVGALAVTGTAISVVALIGVVLLTGIVVNNAIVLVDFVNARRRSGRAKLDAIREAGRARLRPILMTTTTTILALLPLGLGLGQGAELRAPLAIAVIGGLLVSTALTLVVIPVVYATVDRKP
ncbi:MAG: hypothetical protein GF346_07510 [Candidatus Eisenbacteria bacterium]|nr:hypothetical protein [Candidatus Latescibacterota bacterium]MBD3302279.1 hypothetical protein [Candidatus Eisenbacteria bacterium]